MQTTQQNDFYKTLAHALVYFVPLAFLCLFSITLVFDFQEKMVLTEIKSDEQHFIEIGNHSIGEDLKKVITDTNYLVTTDKFLTATSINPILDSSTKLDLEQEWMAFSLNKAIYDQIRWIDNEGREKIRVNYNDGNPLAVSIDKLQDKKHRYYFTDTINLKSGQFFISNLDLNLERGNVEIPIKPMIRVATPIYTQNGDKKGILVINLLAKNLLSKFGHFKSFYGSQHWLLNEDGYWLHGTVEEDQWGFMFHKLENTVASRYPRAWKKISASSQGQFTDHDGLWTFATLYPLNSALQENQSSVDNSDPEYKGYAWKSVVFLPHEKYQSLLNFSTGEMIFYALIILCIFFVISWSLAKSWLTKKMTAEVLLNEAIELNDQLKSTTHQLNLSQQKVEQLMTTDELTGALNSVTFFQQSQCIADRAQRYALAYSVILLEIDFFGKLTKLHGNEIGDIILKEVASIISSNIRSDDLIGRISTHEFAIILSQTSAMDAMDLAERLRNSITEIKTQHKSETITFTASIGIGGFNEERITLDEVLELSNEALSLAKENGRNRVEIKTAKPAP